jgi:hypothetical protein
LDEGFIGVVLIGALIKVGRRSGCGLDGEGVLGDTRVQMVFIGREEGEMWCSLLKTLVAVTRARVFNNYHCLSGYDFTS